MDTFSIDGKEYEYKDKGDGKDKPKRPVIQATLETTLQTSQEVYDDLHPAVTYKGPQLPPAN